MQQRTVLEVVTDFLNKLQIADKKVRRWHSDVTINTVWEGSELVIGLCEHTTGTEISISCTDLDSVDGCSFCEKKDKEE